MRAADFAPGLGAALGTVAGGPLGGFLGGIAGQGLGALFGGSSEDRAAKEHRKRMAEVAARIRATREAQLPARIAMTQNAGAAFAPANHMMRSMSPGNPGVDMGRVLSDPRGQQPAARPRY